MRAGDGLPHSTASSGSWPQTEGVDGMGYAALVSYGWQARAPRGFASVMPRPASRRWIATLHREVPMADPAYEGPDSRRAEGYVGIALYGSVVAGLGGFAVGLFGLFSGNVVGAGMGFAASAIAFGALANALLRR